MTFPAIVPTLSPTASIIFWKQVETGAIEIGFHGSVATCLLLQHLSDGLVHRIIEKFQRLFFVAGWRQDFFDTISQFFARIVRSHLIEPTVVFTLSSLLSRQVSYASCRTFGLSPRAFSACEATSVDSATSLSRRARFDETCLKISTVSNCSQEAKSTAKKTVTMRVCMVNHCRARSWLTSLKSRNFS